MVSPEQSGASVEQEPRAFELYDYTVVMDALRNADLSDDDIAYIGGVIVHWRQSIPMWSAIEGVRAAKSDIDAARTDRGVEASNLLARAELLLTDEHWTQAHEVQREGNAILGNHPGLFVLSQKKTGTLFVIEQLLVNGLESHPAGLWVSGGGELVECDSSTLQVAVDASALPSAEYKVVQEYVAAHEITPNDLEQGF